MTEYKDKKFVSVAKGDLTEKSVNKQKQESVKQAEKEYEDIIKRANDILSESVKQVRFSNRLTSSASCLVADENDMSSNLKRLLEQTGQAVPDTKPILELNSEHPIVEKLISETSYEVFKNYLMLVYEQAVLSEGGQLKGPSMFVKRINNLLFNA